MLVKLWFVRERERGRGNWELLKFELKAFLSFKKKTRNFFPPLLCVCQRVIEKTARKLEIGEGISHAPLLKFAFFLV